MGEHSRSYDKGSQIEIGEHVQALKEHKRDRKSVV